jgi:hypothetical protein
MAGEPWPPRQESQIAPQDSSPASDRQPPPTPWVGLAAARGWAVSDLSVRCHFLQPGAVSGSAERRCCGQEMVQRTTQAVNVRTDICGMSGLALLWGDVVSRAKNLPRRSQPLHGGRLVQRPCQAQIEHFDDAVAGQHQVGWFDVPVDQAVLMRVLQTDRCPHAWQSARIGTHAGDRSSPAGPSSVHWPGSPGAGQPWERPGQSPAPPSVYPGVA